MRKRVLVAFAPAAAAAVCSAALAVPAHASSTQTLAQGPVEALPPGGSFLSIVALPQPAGASLGPHAHVPGFVYALSGKAIVDNGSETTLNAGESLFIPALAAHTHRNADNRPQAGAWAVGLVVGVIVLLVVAARFSRAGVVVLPILLAALVAAGAVALWDPWKNDWYFIGVRPESARGAPMPIPSATRTYESPQFSQVPAGPYVESLTTTTVDPDDQLARSQTPGPVVFLVLEGRAEVTIGNQAPVRLGHHEAALVQTGESFRVLNPSETSLRLLGFALTPKS